MTEDRAGVVDKKAGVDYGAGCDHILVCVNIYICVYMYVCIYIYVLLTKVRYLPNISRLSFHRCVEFGWGMAPGYFDGKKL